LISVLKTLPEDERGERVLDELKQSLHRFVAMDTRQCMQGLESDTLANVEHDASEVARFFDRMSAAATAEVDRRYRRG
jgi:hypothetical protein